MVNVRMSTVVLLFFTAVAVVSGFQIPTSTQSPKLTRQRPSFSQLFEEKNDGVVELADDEDKTTATKEDKSKPVAPFLSQGEVSEEATEMDLSDPKQARVILYIILSLLPVLFLVPLMLGSREMIPADMLPPIEMN